LEKAGKENLVNRLKQAGIIMMGGQKLSLVEALPKEGNLDWLIINTLQDQPFFSAQDEIIRSFGQELHQGILCLEAAVNPVRTIVAMEAAQMDRHEDFVSRLHKSGIKIKTYKRLYPQGDPRMVYEGVTGLAFKTRLLARGSECPGGLSPNRPGFLQCHRMEQAGDREGDHHLRTGYFQTGLL
jgi:Na+-translocating ferredoxin:NAD+ oxidoreductase RnfC subunit